jgi:DNA-binding response OmpR family regulator
VPKLLVVEDDPTLRETLALNLRAEGYEVLLAEDGEQGLRLAREALPDLVVLDVMLPVLDGLTLLRLLRRTSQVPVILLTARSTESDKVVGFETGADDYVVKPFSLGEFLARVRAGLRRGRAAPGAPTTFESGDLKLDLSARRVFRGGVEIAFAPREFELLALFLRNRGAVLTREVVLREAWGQDYPGDPRTVDVHIRWLRERIESDPSRPERIVTVRGVGYRFEG